MDRHVIERGHLRSPIARRLGVATVVGLLAAPSASDSLPARQSPEPRTVDVVAMRFRFEPSVIEVVEGERIRLAVTSADGPHGFEIKNFDVSREIPRGDEAVIIEFTADEPGRFPVVCSAYCGEGHDDMKSALIVHARAEGQ